MSRHWLAMRQTSIDEEKDSIEDILRKLAKTRPALAKKLAAMDWHAILKYVASEALKAVAEKFGYTLSQTYHNNQGYGTGSGKPPKGECVGVLCKDFGHREDAQVGVAIDGTNLSLFWNVYSQECYPQEVARMKEELRAAYKEEALKATMKLVSKSEVTREVHENGSVILTAKIKGV